MGIITFVLIDFQAANSWIGACVHSSVIVAQLAGLLQPDNTFQLDCGDYIVVTTVQQCSDSGGQFDFSFWTVVLIACDSHRDSYCDSHWDRYRLYRIVSGSEMVSRNCCRLPPTQSSSPRSSLADHTLALTLVHLSFRLQVGDQKQ